MKRPILTQDDEDIGFLVLVWLGPALVTCGLVAAWRWLRGSR
jgi:hypothetical protein